MGTKYNRLLNNLEDLNLEGMKDHLGVYIQMINEEQKDVIEALYELTDLEMELRNEKAMAACVKITNFPYHKTLDDFDFSYIWPHRSA